MYEEWRLRKKGPGVPRGLYKRSLYETAKGEMEMVKFGELGMHNEHGGMWEGKIEGRRSVCMLIGSGVELPMILPDTVWGMVSVRRGLYMYRVLTEYRIFTSVKSSYAAKHVAITVSMCPSTGMYFYKHNGITRGWYLSQSQRPSPNLN